MQHIHILVHLKWGSAGAEIVIDAGGQCRIPLNILRVAECSQSLISCPTTACRLLLHHWLEAHGPSFKHLLLLVGTLAHLARHLLLLVRTLAHLDWGRSLLSVAGKLGQSWRPTSHLACLLL